MNAPASTNASISGLILAGGLATRMGGADKPLQLLHGRPLLEHVIERFAPQVSELLISANDAHKYASYDARIVADEFTQAGPLAGMHAGMKAAQHEWLATVPCDAPCFPLDLVARLQAAALVDKADIAIARTGDGRQPVFALLNRSTLPALTAYLQQGRRKADGWYAGLSVTEVEFADGTAFCNINYSDDLADLNAGTGPF